jgi:hypothetical protein
MMRMATGHDSTAIESTTCVMIRKTPGFSVGALSVVRMTIAPSTNGMPAKMSLNRDSRLSIHVFA